MNEAPIVDSEEASRVIAELKRLRAEDSQVYEDLLESLRDELTVAMLQVEVLRDLLKAADVAIP